MPRDFFTTKVRIAQALQKANKPLILQHIARESKLTPQLVYYHIKEMIKWGIAGSVENFEDGHIYYALQPAYYDENWLAALYEIMIPYLNAISLDFDYSQCEVDNTKALLRNLAMFLRLFEKETEKLPTQNNLQKKT